jgi:glycosyltransferase involved in cell wall biosynthesis
VLINPAPPPSDVVAEPLPPGTFVFVGRLTEQKALTVALGALARVPAARLVLIGDGPERARLEDAADAAGVADRVQFLGSLSRDVALRYAAGARASLLSSAWENLPHSAVEALAMGTPVVATSVGGVPEVVRDGENGLLVPPDDPAALAIAMTRVLEDQELHDRLAAAARPSVAAFGRDAIYGRLEILLERAVL